MNFVKFFTAYNVKSSSTLLSDDSQWDIESSFPCARIISQLQLDHRKLGRSEMRLVRPMQRRARKKWGCFHRSKFNELESDIYLGICQGLPSSSEI